MSVLASLQTAGWYVLVFCLALALMFSLRVLWHWGSVLEKKAALADAQAMTGLHYAGLLIEKKEGE